MPFDDTTTSFTHRADFRSPKQISASPAAEQELQVLVSASRKLVDLRTERAVTRGLSSPRSDHLRLCGQYARAESRNYQPHWLFPAAGTSQMRFHALEYQNVGFWCFQERNKSQGYRIPQRFWLA